MEDFLTLENQLCFTIYQTASEFNKLYTEALQPFGITYPQYLVLLALWEHNAVTVKELGEILNLGTGTLTPMVKRMEANGWVKKERSTTDERNVWITLQPKAVEQKQAITEKITKEVQSCHIGLEEYQLLMKQLDSLRLKLKTRK